MCGTHTPLMNPVTLRLHQSYSITAPSQNKCILCMWMVDNKQLYLFRLKGYLHETVNPLIYQNVSTEWKYERLTEVNGMTTPKNPTLNHSLIRVMKKTGNRSGRPWILALAVASDSVTMCRKAIKQHTAILSLATWCYHQILLPSLSMTMWVGKL